jgi:transcriptional regulator with XRE-family HTH domain
MRSTTGIDKKLGENLLKFRMFCGMTQEMLADAVGVTFQQIQKYEKGKNRVSVSRLWQLSQALGIPVAEFYDGIEGAPRSDTLKLKPEQLALIKAYDTLTEAHKKALQDYVRFLRARRGSALWGPCGEAQ